MSKQIKSLFPSVNPRKVTQLGRNYAEEVDKAFKRNDYLFFDALDAFLKSGQKSKAKFLEKLTGDLIHIGSPVISKKLLVPREFSIKDDILSKNRNKKVYDGPNEGIDDYVTDENFYQPTVDSQLEARLDICPVFNTGEGIEILNWVNSKTGDQKTFAAESLALRCLHKILLNNRYLITSPQSELIGSNIIIARENRENYDTTPSILYLHVASSIDYKNSNGYAVSLRVKRSEHTTFVSDNCYVVILYN